MDVIPVSERYSPHPRRRGSRAIGLLPAPLDEQNSPHSDMFEV
jgi:hypothetical protein